MPPADFQHRRQLSRRVGGEFIHGHHDRQAEFLQILDMFFQVACAAHHCRHIFAAQVGLGHPAMHLQRPHRGDQHDRRRFEAAHPALDVKEFLRAQVSAEAGFGHSIISQFQSHPGCGQAVAAVGDIGERTAVDDRRHIFQRLHQVRLDRLFQ